ncbi:MAG: UDP-3-O-(3-hydroxymyristoyl)glucosamine N-acyltransferase, partial [Rhizobiales bacterium]|nr:UDP-3-O-(3-hydroxymyristoyl)glucosamine N-acyltransferase [Hyphomicrobiales bacterium]
MADPVFFAPETSLSVEEIAALTGARPAAGADPALRVSGVAPLDAAGPNDLTFLDGPRYLPLLAATGAAVCLTVARHAPAVPAGVT